MLHRTFIYDMKFDVVAVFCTHKPNSTNIIESNWYTNSYNSPILYVLLWTHKIWDTYMSW